MDLSEENTRDLKEVKLRGLEGGINLVRGLREELRDLDFHLSEARSIKTSCKAKIRMILARVQTRENKSTSCQSEAASVTEKLEVLADKKRPVETSQEPSQTKSITTGIPKDSDTKSTTKTPAPVQQNKSTDRQDGAKKSLNSTRIATGDSQALAVIQSGHKGFFSLDLLEVLLRIIGFERAANRRSIQNLTRSTSTSRPNVMTI